MKKSTIFIAVALLCLNFQLKAETDPITPLKIGDKIPHLLLNFALQDEIQGKTFNLQSLNKRIIILDFWGRYCAPCIKALPGYDKINAKENQSVKIIGISDFTNKQRLNSTLGKFKLNLQHTLTLLSNKTLEAYFPHKILPHSVWIRDGRLYAITDGDYVNEANISKALDDPAFTLPLKIEAQETHPPSLLSFSEQKPNSPKQLFCSAFSSFIPGISPPNVIQANPGTGTITYSFFNKSILNLCRFALDNRTVGEDADFDLQVIDSLRYLHNKAPYYQEWAKENTYCYTVVLPMVMDENAQRDFVEQDLKRWLKLLGIETGKFTEKRAGGPKYWLKEVNYKTAVTNPNKTR